MSLPYLTLYKDGKSRQVFLVDSDVFFAHGWSLDQQPPTVSELPPELELETPPEPELEAPPELELETPKPSTRKPRKLESPDDEQ